MNVASKMYPLRARLILVGRNDGRPRPQRDIRFTKIERFVPGFGPRLTFTRAVHRMIACRRAHPASTRADAPTDAVLSRIVAAYHAARREFVARAEPAADPAS